MPDKTFKYQENTPDLEHLVLMGKVAKPHGIKGELKIFSFTGQSEDFRFFPEILLLAKDGSVGKTYTVLSSRGRGKFAILKLADVEDRNTSEPLVGREVWVKKDFLPPLGENEFYWHEMVGLQVITEDGRELGKVSSLFSAGPHDVLVVIGKGREYLIPAKNEFIVSLDGDLKIMVISPPPGLLEING